jgi:nucleoid-associated protein Lsr2
MYVEHARKGGRARPGRPASGSGNHHAERIGNMKKWAAEQGIDYPKRGRMPKSLIDAYDAAH